MSIPGASPLSRLRWRLDAPLEEGIRQAPEEVPVALVHDGSTTAVMMATPSDLEDLGLGFSMTEGLIGGPSELRAVEVVQTDLGIEVRMWTTGSTAARLAARRRRLAGPTGCGLCGVESLAEAARSPPRVGAGAQVAAGRIVSAMAALAAAQPLGQATRAVHAAALWTGDVLGLVREDVGRHNALDKLVGAHARGGPSTIELLLLTSRVSVEMIQKAAVLGAPIVCAVSAPTTLAVRMAEHAGLTLVGVVRGDGLEIFTHPDRVRCETSRGTPAGAEKPW